MSESAILERIIHLISSLGYWGVALLMLLENVIPPIPSEVIMPLAGFAIARGELQTLPTVLAGTLGSLAGATAWYYVGRRLGFRVIKLVTDRYGQWVGISSSEVERVQQWFTHRRGYWAISVGRLIPGIRTYISIPAGILGMPLPIFLLYSMVGTMTWVIFLTACGYWLGASYAQVGTVLGPMSQVILVGVGLFFLSWLIYQRLSQSRKSL